MRDRNVRVAIKMLKSIFRNNPRIRETLGTRLVGMSCIGTHSVPKTGGGRCSRSVEVDVVAVVGVVGLVAVVRVLAVVNVVAV